MELLIAIFCTFIITLSITGYYYENRITYKDEIIDVKEVYRTSDKQLIGQTYTIKRVYANGKIKIKNYTFEA